MGTAYRWYAQPWGGPWLNIAVPERLRTESNLYLTIGMQSNSFIAPYLARGAGLINFSGSYALGSMGANGARISALIGRYASRVRVLTRGAKLYENNERGEPSRAQVDMALERFDLRVDTRDCETITLKGPVSYLMSCRVIADGADHSARIAGYVTTATPIYGRGSARAGSRFTNRSADPSGYLSAVKATGQERRCGFPAAVGTASTLPRCWSRTGSRRTRAALPYA
jgi:hypothetical protein